MDRSDIPRLVCRLTLGSGADGQRRIVQRAAYSVARRAGKGPARSFSRSVVPCNSSVAGPVMRRCRARQKCWDASARNRSRLLLEATQAIRLASKRFPEKLQNGIVHQERTNMLTPTYHHKRLVGQAQPCCESKGLCGWSRRYYRGGREKRLPANLQRQRTEP
jgi:hypothetical protein